MDNTIDLKLLRLLLLKYGEEITREQVNRLVNAGHKATGTLANSIAFRVVNTADGLDLQFLMEDYGPYVDKGRGPGKMPPVSKIREWCKLKGIPEKAAFPIAQKIGKFGTPPTNFATIPLTRRKAALVKDVSNLMSKEVIKKIITYFNGR